MGTTSFFFSSCLLSTVPPEVFSARGVDCIATLMRDVDPVQPPLVACLLACLLSFLLVCKRELTPQTVKQSKERACGKQYTNPGISVQRTLSICDSSCCIYSCGANTVLSKGKGMLPASVIDIVVVSR